MAKKISKYDWTEPKSYKEGLGAMKKKILLIHKGKSFMLNTIVKNLQNGNYGSMMTEPSSKW